MCGLSVFTAFGGGSRRVTDDETPRRAKKKKEQQRVVVACVFLTHAFQATTATSRDRFDRSKASFLPSSTPLLCVVVGQFSAASPKSAMCSWRRACVVVLAGTYHYMRSVAYQDAGPTADSRRDRSIDRSVWVDSVQFEPPSSRRRQCANDNAHPTNNHRRRRRPEQSGLPAVAARAKEKPPSCCPVPLCVYE